MNAPVTTHSLGPISGKAHVVGNRGSELWSRTIPDVLKGTVSRFPSLQAAVFVEQGIRWSWTDFDREVDALAAGLLKLSLSKGDRVGIWSPNRSEWLLTQFATARIGLILVTINPAYRLSEVEYALNKVECAALVTAATFKSSDYIGMLQTLAPELDTCAAGDLRAEKLPSLRSVIRMGREPTPGMFNFDAILLRRIADTDARFHFKHRPFRAYFFMW